VVNQREALARSLSQKQRDYICDDVTIDGDSTCQTLSKIEQTGFGRSKPILQLCAKETKTPAAIFRRGPYNFCDDVDMRLNYATRQPRSVRRHVEETVDVLRRRRISRPVRPVLWRRQS
jgi:hypothetical protein